MKLFSRLLKEEYDLDTQLLNNKIAQYKHLVKLSLLPITQANPMSDKLDVFDKLRELEQSIQSQLSDRAKADNQRSLFGLDIKNQDNQIRDEFLRVKARSNSVDRYSEMSLKELVKSYFDSKDRKRS
jgi:hypothetical protein